MTSIYVNRGLDKALASNVAVQLMNHDALGAHGRDELGISDTLAAKPIEAALTWGLAGHGDDRGSGLALRSRCMTTSECVRCYLPI